MPENDLVIFYKNPILGKVKTRIAKEMGDQYAFRLYQFLSKHTRDSLLDSTLNKITCYSEYIVPNDIWTDTFFHKMVQKGAGLGQRMQNALFECFHENGSIKAGIVGTDIYPLKAEFLEKGFQELDKHDVVVGPTTDGGYYFIAMKKLHNSLFANMPWSTDQVFDITMQRIAALNLTAYTLPMLRDIDLPEDLHSSGLFTLLNKIN